VWRFCEFFAGSGQVTLALRNANLAGVSLDILHTGKAMDILLALLTVLRLERGSLGVLAPVCSSFGFLCASQSGRCFERPKGHEHVKWVGDSNIMAARTLDATVLTCGGVHRYV
ncbi:unnamed protein product, partial [Symbiodinium sp. KB8]